MVIDKELKSLEFDTQGQVCDFVNSTDTIHKVISIGPNLHANRYVVWFEEYTDKDLKIPSKKEWRAAALLKKKTKKKKQKKS